MPGRRFRIFSRQFKESAVRRILAGEKIRTVAAELRAGRGRRVGTPRAASEGGRVGPAPGAPPGAQSSSAEVSTRWP